MNKWAELFEVNRMQIQDYVQVKFSIISRTDSYYIILFDNYVDATDMYLYFKRMFQDVPDLFEYKYGQSCIWEIRGDVAIDFWKKYVARYIFKNSEGDLYFKLDIQGIASINPDKAIKFT